MIVVENRFALATLTVSSSATAIVLVVIFLSLYRQAYHTTSGRFVLSLSFCNFLYSVTWIVYGVGHFTKDIRLLYNHHNLGNCMTGAVNYFGLFGLCIIHATLFFRGVYTLAWKRVLTFRGELIFHCLWIIISLTIALYFGAACRYPCSNCSGETCSGPCHQEFDDMGFLWGATLALPLILACWLHMLGKRVRLNATTSASSRTTSPRHTPYKNGPEVVIPLAANFHSNLFNELWRPLRLYPWALVYQGLVFVAAGLVGASSSTITPESWRGQIIQALWVCMSAAGLVHAVIYFSTDRTRKIERVQPSESDPLLVNTFGSEYSSYASSLRSSDSGEDSDESDDVTITSIATTATLFT
eukprot:m.208258 g.208258  ORF g.208258 m.208258 type:complete len:357 (+) comp15807_c3_seq13:2852-3922(+)